MKWPIGSEAIKRCPVPSKLQVRVGLEDRWVTVPTEQKNWTWPNDETSVKIEHAVMNAIERMPQDLTHPMTGFKLKTLSVDEYFEKWIPQVWAINIDAS